jgi:integrase
MEAAQRAGQLNRELFEALTSARVETANLFDCLDTWLKETTNHNTRRNYGWVAAKLRKAMPHNPVLSDITPGQVRTFLAGIRAQQRPSTANLALACLKAFFGRFKDSVRTDPTEGAPRFKEEASKVDRAAFTPEQLRAVMALASPFWRAASALAFYTGLRLSDVAMLKVGSLQGNRVVVARTVKTGAPVSVALPASVMAMIREQAPAGADAEDYVWPDAAAHALKGDVTNLSNQFATLLVNAKIRKPQTPSKRKADGRRTVHALSFHSLRHSLVSALANAGINQQVVKKLVGHSSTRINDAYTHIKQDALDRAVALLPDITKTSEP